MILLPRAQPGQAVAALVPLPCCPEWAELEPPPALARAANQPSRASQTSGAGKALPYNGEKPGVVVTPLLTTSFLHSYRVWGLYLNQNQRSAPSRSSTWFGSSSPQNAQNHFPPHNALLSCF